MVLDTKLDIRVYLDIYDKFRTILPINDHLTKYNVEWKLWQKLT